MYERVDWWRQIRAVNQGSEGDVEIGVVTPLLRALGWRPNVIRSKWRVNVKVGRDSKPGFVDFAVVDPHSSDGLIIVEAKKPGEDLKKAVGQADSYARACRALLLIVTDGRALGVWRTEHLSDPTCLLDVPVTEIADRRHELLHLLSPKRVRSAVEQARATAPLERLDHHASLESWAQDQKRQQLRDFLNGWGNYGTYLIGAYLERRSPWLDRFDAASTTDEYAQCLLEHWTSGLGDRHWQFIGTLIKLNPELVLNAAANSEVQRVRNSQALSLRAGSHGAGLTGGTGNAWFSEENQALGALGIPMLTPWTRELETLFTVYNQEQGQRFVDWYEQGDPGGDFLVERVIRLAIRSEYQAALESLEEAGPEPHWPPEQIIARQRLIGTLCRLSGDSARAREHYQAAQNLLNAGTPQDQHLWLRRRLMLDLSPLHKDDWSNSMFDRHAEMLRIPAWFSNPVTDQLKHQIATALLKESRAQHLDRPTGSRSSTLIGDAWRDYVKALFFAFCAGDHYTVREVHLHWARLLLTLRKPLLDHVLEVLWLLNEDDLLASVVQEQPLEAFEAWKEWDQLLLLIPANPAVNSNVMRSTNPVLSGTPLPSHERGSF
jgi:Type I restriction enzyme R protein N terminus (HSDR_N)